MPLLYILTFNSLVLFVYQKLNNENGWKFKKHPAFKIDKNDQYFNLCV